MGEVKDTQERKRITEGMKGMGSKASGDWASDWRTGDGMMNMDMGRGLRFFSGWVVEGQGMGTKGIQAWRTFISIQ